ncbi:hypothetical protein H6P81_008905 [Aristolochia fimbriata]|uniref:Ribosomal protein L34Ae n=1 Tax=Aristolochia fimbriata TaxID=158543 RepID=A0AAV7EJC3_ARIFI|nr:hypothetical protein H6P81_008905 [Aristolochia fimbriata]
MGVMLFFHVSTPFNVLFLFFYFSSIFFAKFLLSRFRKLAPTSTRRDDFVDSGVKDDAGAEKEDLIADVVHGGDDLVFQRYSKVVTHHDYEDTVLVEDENDHTEDDDHENATKEEHVSDAILFPSRPEDEDEEAGDLSCPVTPIPKENPYFEISFGTESSTQKEHEVIFEPAKEDKKLRKEESFSVNDHRHRKFDVARFFIKEEDGEEIRADSFTGGSTSNSSRDWRSSTIFRDSETDDPFSSSSRRSASHWETYTVYRKYDEEMMFLDRVSAQKLTETESLRSVEVHPRSVSRRILHKLASRSKRVTEMGKSPYHELEAAYVAQLCLAWEALNWNYKNFCRVKMQKNSNEEDTGCPAQVAQQFQQFQVLLQRFIETEPFETGTRPEIYARMRISRPKLLQVPEFQGSEGDQGKEGIGTRIPSAEFLFILEDAIRTFMNFVRADKESYYRKIGAFFKKKQGSVDPTLHHLIKKANKRKRRKLQDLQRSKKCFRKKRLKEEEEIELLMSKIDLKVVSRVLRMSDLNEEQLHWCEEKMSKVRVWEGKLQRDSSPLFFPAH